MTLPGNEEKEEAGRNSAQASATTANEQSREKRVDWTGTRGAIQSAVVVPATYPSPADTQLTKEFAQTAPSSVRVRQSFASPQFRPAYPMTVLPGEEPTAPAPPCCQ